MRMVATGLGTISLLVLLAPGCGGDGGGSVPFDHSAVAYATVFCHKAFICCDATELAQKGTAGADETTCLTTYAAGIRANSADYPAAIAAGRIIYHGDRVRRCIDTIAALPCAQWGADEELRRFPDCFRVYDGTVAPGGACANTAECAGGYCELSSGAGVCVAYAKIGESCVSVLCQPELSCASDSSGFPTVCAPPLADGAACSYDSDCASTFCEANVCGPPTMCNGV